jgi:putative membrane protein
MMLRWLFAALHLLALGIGFGAIVARASALRGTLDGAGIRRVLYADTAWGIAALLWIATGLLRAFAGFEKGTAYYVANNMFWIKMGLLVAIIVMEIPAAATFARWRVALRRKQPVDTGSAQRFARVSTLQIVLVVLMVFAATAMARGFLS